MLLSLLLSFVLLAAATAVPATGRARARARADRPRPQARPAVGRRHLGAQGRGPGGHDAAVEGRPDLRFDLDLSHYIVAGEIGGVLSPEADRRFDVVMQRAAMLDGRASNGEQVQVDKGAGGRQRSGARVRRSVEA